MSPGHSQIHDEVTTEKIKSCTSVLGLVLRDSPPSTELEIFGVLYTTEAAIIGLCSQIDLVKSNSPCEGL